MRKLGAISLAAFYLLLTTGMFVCLVHCCAEYLFAKPGYELAEHDDDGDSGAPTVHHDERSEGKHHNHKKSCGEGKNCSCCNQHWNYVVKENIANGLDTPLTTLHTAFLPLPYQHQPLISGVYIQKISWLNAKGPPLFSDKPFYICYRSLLI